MGKDEITPEEKLLRIIENRDTEPSEKSVDEKNKKDNKYKNLGADHPLVKKRKKTQPKGFWGKLFHKQQTKREAEKSSPSKADKKSYKENKYLFSKTKRQKEESNIKIVNRFLIVLICGLFIYMGIDVLLVSQPQYNMYSLMAESFSMRKQRQVIMPLNSVDYYLEGVNERDIFSPVEEEEKIVIVPEEKPEPVKLDVSFLKLVGVSWEPGEGSFKEVMLEDTVQKQTFFLNEGDQISGFVIEKILQDSVILSKDGRQIELK